jgi:hypothetical protein
MLIGFADGSLAINRKNWLPAFAFRKHPDLEPALQGLKAIKTGVISVLVQIVTVRHKG